MSEIENTTPIENEVIQTESEIVESTIENKKPRIRKNILKIVFNIFFIKE